MAEGTRPPIWQQQMRVRAFRLLGSALPIVMASLIMSSLVPHGGSEKEILSRPWGDAVLVKGRIDLPKRDAEEIQAIFVSVGPLPPPVDRDLAIRVKSLDGGFDTRKRWKFKPQIKADKTWTANFPLKLPSGALVAYKLKTEKPSPALAAATLRVISDPVRSIDKYLRLGEAFFIPSLVLSLLAITMLLFAKFSM